MEFFVDGNGSSNLKMSRTAGSFEHLGKVLYWAEWGGSVNAYGPVSLQGEKAGI